MNTTTTKKDQGSAGAHTDKARDEAQTAADKARDAASHAGQAVSSAASAATEKAKDLASQAGQAVGNLASQAGQAVTGAASAVGTRADTMAGSAGHGARSLAETVRDQGPSGGVLGSATHAVADALEQGGRYLEEHKLSGMADDLGDLIRRNPIPAVLIGVGLGFLLGRVMRS